MDWHKVLYRHAWLTNPNDFGDPLTFPLAPPQGSRVVLSEMSQQLLDGLPLVQTVMFTKDETVTL